MSGRATRPSPAKTTPSPAPPAGTAAESGVVVQQLLAERRDLLIANERLKLELAELRGRPGWEDPRLSVLELENRALREELASVRRDLDRFEQALEHLLEEIEKASP